MGPTCKLIESSRCTSTLVRAQETAAADAWPGKAVATCQQGPSCPGILARALKEIGEL